MYTATDRPTRGQFIQCDTRDQDIADGIMLVMAALAPFAVLFLTYSI